MRMDRIDYIVLRNNINRHLRSGGQVTLIWYRPEHPDPWDPENHIIESWETLHVIDGARIRRNKLQVREVSQTTGIKRWKSWREREYEVRYADGQK